MTHVMVAGDMRPIRGPIRRARFHADLQSCGEFEAAIHFDKWRRKRTAVHVWGALALTGYGFPALGGLTMAAIEADVSKRRMIRALGAE